VGLRERSRGVDDPGLAIAGAALEATRSGLQREADREGELVKERAGECWRDDSGFPRSSEGACIKRWGAGGRDSGNWRSSERGGGSLGEGE